MARREPLTTPNFRAGAAAARTNLRGEKSVGDAPDRDALTRMYSEEWAAGYITEYHRHTALVA